MSELRRRLKLTTQTLHDRVEATDFMGRLMRDDLTVERYALTLSRLHGLYAPIEDALLAVPHLTATLPDLDRRMKARALAADLDSLRRAHPNVTSATTPVEPPTIAAIPDVPSALGTLYVLEGSTMGGRLIATKLRTRPFVTSETLHFFEHYGTAAGAYWQTFLKTLELVPHSHHDHAVAAAERTFGYFLELAR